MAADGLSAVSVALETTAPAGTPGSKVSFRYLVVVAVVGHAEAEVEFVASTLASFRGVVSEPLEPTTWRLVAGERPVRGRARDRRKVDLHLLPGDSHAEARITSPFIWSVVATSGSDVSNSFKVFLVLQPMELA